MSSSSGLHMSCLLHLWAETDWRVRPLVATVRRWARANGLVREVESVPYYPECENDQARPTPFFTNFTLTMLVVCYLQSVHMMLPSVLQLQARATNEDHFKCEVGIWVPGIRKRHAYHLSSVHEI